MKKYGRGVYNFGSSFIQCVIPYEIITENKELKSSSNLSDGQPTSDGINDGINDGIKLSEIHHLILKSISLDCKTTAKQVTEQYQKKIRTVERAFKYLKDNGFIERVGSNKTGYWRVLKSDLNS